MAVSSATEIVTDQIRESVEAQERLLDGEHVERIVAAAEVITTALRGGHKLLLFGNGGSAADATHIAAEFLGRFLRERPAVPAISLSDNSSTVTAIGNDYDYSRIFARQVEGLGQPGDVAFGISTSGGSLNVLAAMEVARERGLRTIGLTGGTGGALRDAVELPLVVPADTTPRIQEAHTLVAHILCDLVERALVEDA
jgi:D-sedoheptulose 7-phosphate isomerase